MDEDGDGFIKEESEAKLEGEPFVFVNLNSELLGAAVVAAVEGATLFGEVAEFFFECFAFFSPWDEDGLGFCGAGGKHFCGELGGPIGDFVQVAMMWLKVFAFFALVSLALSGFFAKCRK